jgi:hypothetical protein
LQALVLAERVYSEHTGKKIIAGTFNRVFMERKKPKPEGQPNPPEPPSNVLKPGNDPGCPAAYVSLTDVIDGTEVTLQFVNVSKNQVLYEAPTKINCNDRLATVEMAFALPPLGRCITEPGTYSLDIVWRGEILGSHRIVATEKLVD